jgi:type IV fimbrial biogenesis protein FimT
MAGVTLVELLVALALASILLVLAAPSFRDLALNAQRSSVLTDLAGSVLLARSESLKRAVKLSLCPSADGATCRSGTAPEWSAGWILFEDADGDREVDSGEPLVRAVRYDNPAFSLLGASGLERGITFRQGGFPHSTGRLEYCEEGGTASRRIHVNAVGRIKVESIDGGCSS